MIRRLLVHLAFHSKTSQTIKQCVTSLHRRQLCRQTCSRRRNVVLHFPKKIFRLINIVQLSKTFVLVTNQPDAQIGVMIPEAV